MGIGEGGGVTRRYGLRDDQWARIEHLLPGRVGYVGGTARDNRLFVEAVRYRYRAGLPWRDLPERFGGWKNTHPRFSRWAKRGVWARVFAALSSGADNEYADRRHDRPGPPAQRGGAERGGGDEAIGRSKGGLSTKIHATVDALGNPTGFALTAGQASDLVGADELLPEIAAPTVIADKGYAAEARVLAPLRAAGKDTVIPPRRNRKDRRDYDRDRYQARHLIEHCFCTVKQFRAIATRYDKTQRNFLAAVYLAASAILLN